MARATGAAVPPSPRSAASYTAAPETSSIPGTCAVSWDSPESARRRLCDDQPHKSQPPALIPGIMPLRQCLATDRVDRDGYRAHIVFKAISPSFRSAPMSAIAITDDLFFNRAGLDRGKSERTVAEALKGGDDGELFLDRKSVV